MQKAGFKGERSSFDGQLGFESGRGRTHVHAVLKDRQKRDHAADCALDPARLSHEMRLDCLPAILTKRPQGQQLHCHKRAHHSGD